MQNRIHFTEPPVPAGVACCSLSHRFALTDPRCIFKTSGSLSFFHGGADEGSVKEPAARGSHTQHRHFMNLRRSSSIVCLQVLRRVTTDAKAAC